MLVERASASPSALHLLNLPLRFLLLLRLQLPFHQFQAIHELLLEGPWTLRRRSPPVQDVGLDRTNEVLRQALELVPPVLVQMRRHSSPA